jgi:hypothetical protein
MSLLFKATRPDGTDFNTGTVDYASKAGKRLLVKHPNPVTGSVDAIGYLSLATLATDCTGFRWPCRLFEVEAVGPSWTPHAGSMPNKRAATKVRVIRELPAWQVFGPNGEAIVKIIEAFDKLTPVQRAALRDAYYARSFEFNRAWSVAYLDGLSRRVGLGAARYALRDRLFNRDGWYVDYTAYGAALAVLLRDRIGDEFTQANYNALTMPWAKVMGEAHPADKTLAGAK